jgi:hypothetical protein
MPGGPALPAWTTLIRLRSGGLVVVSPPAVEAGGLEQIDALGGVEEVLVPNSFHHLNARAFLARYPHATLRVVPGLHRRVPGLPSGDELSGEPPPSWRGAVEHAVLGPVRGLAEAALFHAPSGTLVLTDLAFHMLRFESRVDRAFWRLVGVPSGFGPSRTARLLLLRDRALAAAFLERVLAWPFRRVLVAHGEPLERDAAAVFRRAFAPYLAGGVGSAQATAAGSGEPKLYGELASWWPLLSRPADYAEEAAFYERTLVAACERPPRTLLELGSGGGNNASHLKARFEIVLVDRSEAMLAVSRALNPECEHVLGDMRTVRLGREFDCVFVHDAVAYMTSESDLRRAIETAFVHCRRGGAALFAPDHVRESFRPSTGCGGHDGERRSLRYLEWTWDPDPADTTYVVDFAYLLREGGGSVRVERDRHVEGLFSRADWLRLLSEAGFRPRSVPFEHSEVEAGACEAFVASKPLASPR